MHRQIRSGNLILAVYVPRDWQEGLQFYSGEEDFVQVGTWRYPAGQVLKAHKHNRVNRSITHTQEVVFVRKGSVKATVYDPEGKPVEHLLLCEGDTLVLLNGGHGYEILDNDTQVLEVKNGPYLGAEIDRTRL